MPVRRRRTKRVFGLALTEVAFMLVFLLLSPLAVSVSQDEELEGAQAQLAEFQERVKGVLDILGVSLDELRKTASALVAANLVEKSKLDLSELISGLLADNRKLRAEKAQLEATVLDLTERVAVVELDPVAPGSPTGTGGTEPGGCWLTGEGHVEYFVDVVIHDEHADLGSAWPSSRQQELESWGINPTDLPVTDIGTAAFALFAEPVYLESIGRGCRHFARLTDRTTNKESYKRQRRLVERYFFVNETEQ